MHLENNKDSEELQMMDNSAFPECPSTTPLPHTVTQVASDSFLSAATAATAISDTWQ